MFKALHGPIAEQLTSGVCLSEKRFEQSISSPCKQASDQRTIPYLAFTLLRVGWFQSETVPQ